MQWVNAILKLLGIGQSASKGYYGLVGRLERRLDATESRLDECERDRDELRSRIDELLASNNELRGRIQLLEDQSHAI